MATSNNLGIWKEFRDVGYTASNMEWSFPVSSQSRGDFRTAAQTGQRPKVRAVSHADNAVAELMFPASAHRVVIFKRQLCRFEMVAAETDARAWRMA